MLKSLRVFVLTVALMLMASTPALAGTQDFMIINNTGSTIFHIFCSSADSNSWEEDLLGDSGTISPGASATIRFDPAENSRYWDLRVVFDNGADLYWSNVDLFSIGEITVNSDGTANFR